MASATRTTVNDIANSVTAPAQPGMSGWNYLNPHNPDDRLKMQGLYPTQLPDYYSALPGVQDKLNGIQYDPSGLNAFKAEALRTGPSPWALMQQKQNQLTTQGNLNAASAQNNAQTQAASLS